MLGFISKFIKKKIVVVIGERSATLYCIAKEQVVESVFLDGIWDEIEKEIEKFIVKYPRHPVYLLIDTGEQSVSYNSIVYVRNAIFKKLVQKKIRKEYKTEDFKNYYTVVDKSDKKKKKDKNVRRNLNYVIADISNNPPLSDWIKYLKKKQVVIGGVYSIPIEVENIAKELDLIFYPKKKKKLNLKLKKKSDKVKTEEVAADPKENEVPQPERAIPEVNNRLQPKWKLIVLQNFNSGIRIVALKDNIVVFTRLLHFLSGVEEAIPEKIAQIKTQISGTIEYLKRLDFRDQDGIDICFFVTDLLEKQLRQQIGESKSVKYIDLKEVNKTFFKKEAKFDASKGADSFVATFFANKGRYFFFLDPQMKKVVQLLIANLLVTGLLVFVVIGVLATVGVRFVKLSSLSGSIDTYQEKAKVYGKKLEKIRKETFGTDIDENMVIEVNSLHKKLLLNSSSPVEFVSKFSVIRPSTINVKEIEWEEKSQGKYSIKILASFETGNLTVEELFVQYDSFIRNIKTEFNNYRISHSELPSSINFGGAGKNSLPIEIELEGPHG